jgi:3-mercaptopyruvate sulfurtransferase SseA
VRVNADALDTSGLSSDRDIVAYDSDLEELVSARVAAALIRQGFRACALQGGLAEWVTAKFPTDTKAAPKQAPPKAGGLK